MIIRSFKFRITKNQRSLFYMSFFVVFLATTLEFIFSREIRYFLLGRSKTCFEFDYNQRNTKLCADKIYFQNQNLKIVQSKFDRKRRSGIYNQNVFLSSLKNQSISITENSKDALVWLDGCQENSKKFSFCWYYPLPTTLENIFQDDFWEIDLEADFAKDVDVSSLNFFIGSMYPIKLERSEDNLFIFDTFIPLRTRYLDSTTDYLVFDDKTLKSADFLKEARMAFHQYYLAFSDPKTPFNYKSLILLADNAFRLPFDHNDMRGFIFETRKESFLDQNQGVQTLKFNSFLRVPTVDNNHKKFAITVVGKEGVSNQQMSKFKLEIKGMKRYSPSKTLEVL